MSATLPTQGTIGSRVNVLTNAFEIVSLPKVPFYQYDVIAQHQPDGAPPKVLDPGRRYREIVDKLQTDHAQVFRPRACFDGSKILYSSTLLPSETFVVNMSKDSKSSRGQFSVRITQVSVLRPEDWRRYPISATHINLLQVILTQNANIKHRSSLKSKSFYISSLARDLPSGLQACKGFFQSVRPVMNKIVVNVDTTTAAVYKPGPLLDNAMSVLQCGNDIRRLNANCENAQSWRKLSGMFKNVTVMVNPIKKVKKINGLLQRAGRHEFQKDGALITVEEYFRETYGIQIRYPDAFGVKVGKDAVYPAELCIITPGQLYKKKLDPSDMSEFLRFAVARPDERKRLIRNAVAGTTDSLEYGQSIWMGEAGLKVSPNLLHLVGRELHAPSVIYAGVQLPVRDGSWNLKDQRFQEPAGIISWAVVYFDSPNSHSAVNKFARMLFANLQKLGVTFMKAAPHIMPGNQGDVDKSLNEAKTEAIKGYPGGTPPKPPLIVVVLPQNAAGLRKAVKQWGDMRQGIPTQCVRQGKYDEKLSDQYVNNIALKINVKCGGVNSFVRLKSGEHERFKNTMFVGCDVTHPSPGVQNRPSVTSLVASIDPEATRYASFVGVQEPRTEIIADIKDMFNNALDAYGNAQKAYPQNIVVFRDGVSEGEYSQVERFEIHTIEEVIKERIGKQVNLIFIVVSKRHHIRFFPEDQANRDRSGNCNPGLVVDREIVQSNYMDFYLQSHSGIIGTSRPSHYIVLRNVLNWSADRIQEISYALCHVYAAATRSVSIPAPVYYADRVCSRADFHFRSDLQFSDEVSSNGVFQLAQWKSGFLPYRSPHKMFYV